MRRILVNQSYAMQKVTGQQRYATEIGQRLLGREGFERVQPQGFWVKSALRVWLWVMAVLPFVARSAVVLSMTARAPLWQRRHVLVVHDLFVLTNPEWFSRTYVWTHAPLLRSQLRRAAALVAVSQPVADELASYDAPVRVAPNAPSAVFTLSEGPKADDKGAVDALAELGLVAGSYFLTVGSMDPRKNLPLLAQAYAKLTEHERQTHPLVVVGGGSRVFRSQEIEWPAEVVDAGYVTDEELRQLYRGSLAVVFASLAEGFGLPLVEAAAAGATSLVISDIPVFRWVCDAAAEYVDPTSVSSVVDGLRSAMVDPTRQTINLDRFSWDESARVIGEVCQAVAVGT